MSDNKKEQISRSLVIKIVAASVLCTLLLIVLVFAVIYGITGSLAIFGLGKNNDAAATTPATTAPSGNTTAEPQYYDWSEYELKQPVITEILSYTADDETLVAIQDEVVITFDGHELTNGQMQAFYWGGFYEFMSYYNNDTATLASFGLDLTKPLDEQTLHNSSITWQQYFLDGAVEQWVKYVILNDMADEANFKLSDADQKKMDEMATQIEETAKSYKFENAAAMVKAQMGSGLSVDDYIYYLQLTGRGDKYYTQLCNDQEVDLEKLSAYFDENAAMFEQSYGITKDSGKLISIRHVLIKPEGGTTDDYGNTTYEEGEWDACRVEAQALYDAWVASGAKEESFKDLANNSSDDEGSNTNGGLYENVYQGWAVAEFDDWCFAEGRKSGDHGLIKTNLGYHLMYYVSGEEGWIIGATPYYKRQCALDLLDEALQAGTLVVNYQSIKLGTADISAGAAG